MGLLFVSCATAFDLLLFEFPETSHAMGEHCVFVDPPINGVTTDPEILAYFVYR
jgi:hypothetical protein